VRHEIIQVRDLSAFAELHPAWTRLERESRCHPVGLTYRYAELAAAKLLAEGAKIRVIKVCDDAGLALLWPLFIRRKGWVRMAYDLRCGGGADRGGPLTRDDVSADCLRAAIRALMRAGADIFVLDWTDDDTELQKVISNWALPWIIRRLPARLRAAGGSEGARRYAIKFDNFPTWGDFIASRSRAVRHGHDRQLKRLLAEQQNVEFGWCQTAEDAEQILKWVFESKRRWAVERGIDAGTLIAREIEAFYIALAHRTDLRATPLVAFVKVGGRPAAASLNAVGPTLMEGLIIAHDQAFQRYSPGTLLLHYQAKWACETGREFDMLRHDADYKTHWATHMPVSRRHAIFLASNSVRGLTVFIGLAMHKLGELCARKFGGAIRSVTAKAEDIAGAPDGAEALAKDRGRA
jgi:CelD/BcsL family acetyltransferase involved in cellulose biosynthesis